MSFNWNKNEKNRASHFTDIFRPSKKAKCKLPVTGKYVPRTSPGYLINLNPRKRTTGPSQADRNVVMHPSMHKEIMKVAPPVNDTPQEIIRIPTPLANKSSENNTIGPILRNRNQVEADPSFFSSRNDQNNVTADQTNQQIPISSLQNYPKIPPPLESNTIGRQPILRNRATREVDLDYVPPPAEESVSYEDEEKVITKVHVLECLGSNIKRKFTILEIRDHILSKRGWEKNKEDEVCENNQIQDILTQLNDVNNFPDGSPIVAKRRIYIRNRDRVGQYEYGIRGPNEKDQTESPKELLLNFLEKNKGESFSAESLCLQLPFLGESNVRSSLTRLMKKETIQREKRKEPNSMTKSGYRSMYVYSFHEEEEEEEEDVILTPPLPPRVPPKLMKYMK